MCFNITLVLCYHTYSPLLSVVKLENGKNLELVYDYYLLSPEKKCRDPFNFFFFFKGVLGEFCGQII